LADTEQRAARIFREVAPSVVLVVKAKRSPGLIGPNTADIRTASGFVWDAEGHNVTTNLGVTGAELVQVRFAAGQLRRAEVLGSAPEYGLAVLRVEGMIGRCKPVPRGSSANLAVGQAVFAIGDPFRLSGSLTQGLVSSLRPGRLAYAGPGKAALIQTDAPSTSAMQGDLYWIRWVV
jgi:S1-C subfamily serine protease